MHKTILRFGRFAYRAKACDLTLESRRVCGKTTIRLLVSPAVPLRRVRYLIASGVFLYPLLSDASWMEAPHKVVLAKDWLTIQGPQSTTGMEWAWAIARIVIVLTVATSAWLFMRGNPAQQCVLAAVGFVFVYDMVLAVLIKRGRVAAAFNIGFLLDHVVLLSVWWLPVRHGGGGTLRTTCISSYFLCL